MRGICGWAVLLTAAFLIGSGCNLEKGRFASCETDDDCKGSDEARPYCWNLRCVGCAYDRHCKDGEICDSKDHNCSPL